MSVSDLNVDVLWAPLPNSHENLCTQRPVWNKKPILPLSLFRELWVRLIFVVYECVFFCFYFGKTACKCQNQHVLSLISL